MGSPGIFLNEAEISYAWNLSIVLSTIEWTSLNTPCFDVCTSTYGSGQPEHESMWLVKIGMKADWLSITGQAWLSLGSKYPLIIAGILVRLVVSSGINSRIARKLGVERLSCGLVINVNPYKSLLIGTGLGVCLWLIPYNTVPIGLSVLPRGVSLKISFKVVLISATEFFLHLFQLKK